MEKVIIIGCPGAGKSTFSRQLKEITNLPLYYLDRLWHNKDKTTVSKEEFVDKLTNLVKDDMWIIDGTYISTLDIRLDKCDTVFFLDFPLETCLLGAASRIGKAREDMPWVETEFDDEFRQWIINFETDQLPIIYRKLDEQDANKDIHIFKSREEVNTYLIKLKEGTIN